MGKSKKDKKNKKDDDFEETGVDVATEDLETIQTTATSNKKGKKNRKKNDDWEEDIANEIAGLSMTENGNVQIEEDNDIPVVVKKNKKKKTRPKVIESDPEEEEEDLIDDDVTDEDVNTNASKKTGKSIGFSSAAFSNTNDGGDDDNEDVLTSDDDEAEETKEVVQEPVKKVDNKKSKKQKKQKSNDSEDIDAILAMIEGGAKKVPDSLDADVIEGAPSTAEVDGDSGSIVKSAAQKKKEKKERQKQEKLQKAKNKFDNTKSTKTKDNDTDELVSKTAVTETVEEGAEVKDEAEADATNGKEGKTKKKKKKKGEKVEEEKKKPSKMVKAMQERLKLMQEEEIRLKFEQEEKIRLEEESERIQKEKEAAEKERKEAIKTRKREAVEKLKAEGKYLTPKQKEAQRRAQQMLETMKLQGIDVPAKTEIVGSAKKRVVYAKKKKFPQHSNVQQVLKDTPEPEIVTPKISSPEPSIEKEEEKKDELDEVKDEPEDAGWDDSSEDEDTNQDNKTSNAKQQSGDNAELVDAKKEDLMEPHESNDEDDSTESCNSSEDDNSDDSDDSESEYSDESDDGLTNREKAEKSIARRKELAEAKRSVDVLRAPVVVVLGHVDTGKTKILDKLRRTNVQDGEAGGITQQIGATNVPHDAIKEQTRMCKDFQKKELKLPGMLIIDTPGHESFSNLRSRGSSLCDIAILVVDIMHGLEPQTLESIKLLLSRKTPFIVALNKVDRLFQWASNPHGDIINTLKKQKPNTKLEFEDRLQHTILQFAEQGLNAKIFNENTDYKEYISLVPTSAHSGDGIGNLIALICEISQTSLAKRISYSDELKATAMEVKSLPGLGTTVDVILVNGSLKEGDHIILAGTDGPITTQIRGLLMPKPMREIRVKSNYDHHKEVKAAQGVKVIAKDLEKALAGLPVFVSHSPEETEICKEDISVVLKDVLDSMKVQERGVYVQASTLGSLEALLEFLRTSKIPCAGINIGPVHKKDIMKASVMIEHDSQYAVVLAFDVKVERDAQEMADSVGVTVFQADIIYHLFDRFMEFREKHKREKQEQYKFVAVFPCKLRILPQCVFKSRDPIICGVIVEAGFLKVGTPVCVPAKEFLNVGRITSLEFNKKPIDKATKGQEVCIKIEGSSGEAPKMIGRHFDETDMLYSKISRESIDAVKNYFRDDMTKNDWQLMVELKKTFDIL